MSDGLLIWQDRDPVHLTDTAYMEIGMVLLCGIDDDEDVFQPPKKRQRLESIVPVVPAKPENVAKTPLPTAGWLTGRLTEPKRGGQRGCWSRGGGRGNGGPGGFVRGGNRSGSRGRRS